MPQSSGTEQNQSPDSLFHNVENTETRTETVIFQEDGEVATQSTSTKIMDSTFFAGASDGLENSVKGFLSRPVLIKNFEWLSSQDVMADVTPGNTFPNDWLARPMIRSKIDGFRYFRGTLVLRVQVNAQPFNAGRLLVWFNPYGFQEINSPSSINYLGGITGYRHVDLDIGETTSAELRVPFMCPLTHIDLLNNAGNMGSLRYTVYSKLRGSTSIEGAIWAHFEDIDIQMPTGHPLAAFTVQGNQKQVDAEKPIGDFENLFKAQSRVAKRLGDVPVIGSFAKGAGWVTDQLAGLAGMFGWSKPTNDDIPTQVDPKYLKTYANFNGKTQGKPLGFDARNSTQLPNGISGTDADEMCLAHILQQPIFTTSFLFSVGQAPGTVLLKWPVHPGSCVKNTVAGVTTWNNTYLSYLSQLFEWWRGGLCYSFKVVKTPFHSGRIRIVFVPGADLDTDLTTIDQDKCYTKIVDLRDANSFEFKIPFVSNAIWMPIRHDINTANPSGVLADTPTGLFYVEVLNTLRAGGQAANDIEILLETFADKDFQFAFLTRKVDLDVVIPRDDNKYTVQIGVGQTNRSPEDLFPSKNLSEFDPNMVSMGEAITSLRQVLKRYTRIQADPMPAPVSPNVSNAIFPYAIEQSAPSVKDLFSYVAQLYRIQSGGMKLLLAVEKGLDSVVMPYSLQPYEEITLTTNVFNPVPDPVDTNHGQPGGIFFTGLENTLEVDIPFYQPYPFIPTAVGNMKASTDIAGIGPKLVPFNLGPIFTISNTVPVSLHRIIGEDFSFSYLIGPPQTSYTPPPPPPKKTPALICEESMLEKESHENFTCQSKESSSKGFFSDMAKAFSEAKETRWGAGPSNSSYRTAPSTFCPSATRAESEHFITSYFRGKDEAKGKK